MSQPSARPSLIVHSTALRFGTGSAPGCARQTGHVRVFGSAKYSTSQRQNIFVRVFRWAWISSPTTVSQLGRSTIEQVLRLAQRTLDVAAHLDHREPVLQHEAADPDEPELPLPRFERQLDVVHEHGTTPVEDPATDAEHALDRRDELSCGVDEDLHRRRSGTAS